MILDLFFITITACFIVDLSGVVDSIKEALLRVSGGKFGHTLKPLDCSLCVAWWASLGYLFFTASLSPGSVAAAGMFSLLSRHFTTVMVAIGDLMDRVISKLFK